MKKLIKVQTLFDMLESEMSEDRGFLELKQNGYEDDMKEMFGLTTVGNIENFDFVEKEAAIEMKEVKIVQMAVWIKGRLYDSEKVVAYKIDESWWVEQVDGAEWFC